MSYTIEQKQKEQPPDNELENVKTQNEQQNNNENHNQDNNQQSQENQEKEIFMKQQAKQLFESNKQITLLRAKNDGIRDNLKKLAFEAEKIIERSLQKKIIRQEPKKDYSNVKNEAIRKQGEAILYNDVEIQKTKQQIQQIKSSVPSGDYEDIVQKIKIMKNTKKDQELQIKKQENMYKDFKKDYDSIKNSIVEADPELQIRIDELQQQIKDVRDKIKDKLRENTQQQKQFKEQHEDFVIWESHFQKEAFKKGYNAHLFEKEASNEFESKRKYEVAQIDFKADRLPYLKDPKEKELTKTEKEYTPEAFKQTIEAIQKLQDQKQKQDADSQFETEQQLNQKTQALAERNAIMNKMKEREHEANTLVSKYNELRRLINHKSSNAINTHLNQAKNKFSRINESQIKIGNASQVKTSLDIEKNVSLKDQLIKTTRTRGYHREVSGFFKASDAVIIFDDSKFLNNPSELKISKVIVYYRDQTILGIKAHYTLFDEEIEGPNNVQISPSDTETDIQQKELEIKGDDYLRFITGYSTDGIDMLRLETNQEKKIQIGQIANNKKYQEVKIEVYKDYMPISFIGALDYRQNSGAYALICIGLEMKMTFDPLRLHQKRAGEVEEDIVVSEGEEDNKDKRLRRIVMQRKVRYKIKKNPAPLLQQKNQHPVLSEHDNSSDQYEMFSHFEKNKLDAQKYKEQQQKIKSAGKLRQSSSTTPTKKNRLVRNMSQNEQNVNNRR